MSERTPAQKQEPLSLLFQQRLSSVVFVQDYLQLDFDGSRLTFNIWPSVSTSTGDYSFSTPGYRDALCSLISKEVTAISSSDEQVEIAFSDRSRVVCDLRQQPDDEGERVLFFAEDGKTWANW
jgi:hypothetical protein